MPETDQFYKDLLKNNPDLLILNIQPLIDSTIYQFVKVGRFLKADHNEIRQEVNEKLLKRIHKIRDQFNNKSLLTTYLIAVIRNICHDIHRKKISEPVFLNYEATIVNLKENDSFNSLVLKEEKVRLKKIMELFFNERDKLILCLKLKYRIPFTYNDIKLAAPCISIDEYKSLYDSIKPYLSATDSMIYAGLTGIFNKHEKKKNSPDALRKWISKKTTEIISLLNTDLARHNYTEETLQILFEMCFVEKSEKVSETVKES
jgi:DNA-directed RNA polymerase specialized sigma24 family protein